MPTKTKPAAKTNPPAPEKAGVTPGILIFEQSATSVKLAKLDGRELEPHEGYSRDNHGGWCVPIQQPDGSRDGFCVVNFKGSAKRGQEYNSPDPEGQANAAELVRRWNCEPGLRELLTQAVTYLKSEHVRSDKFYNQDFTKTCEAALAQTGGEG